MCFAVCATFLSPVLTFLHQYVGSIVAAWTIFGTISYTGNAAWRIPVGLQALMPFVQFVLIWLLPESPRWLCSKDRGDEAFQILVKVRIHA